MSPRDIEKIAQAINSGRIGVMPTDTIYGIVGRADMPDVAERIYQVKQRPNNKKFIKLIESYDDLPKIGITLSRCYKNALAEVWPGPVSVELPSTAAEFYFLHFGSGFQAVRMPEPDWLQELLSLTGPIVATSANISGLPIAQNIDDIKAQLPGMDFYYEGPAGNTPSKLARINESGVIEWLKRV